MKSSSRPMVFYLVIALVGVAVVIAALQLTGVLKIFPIGQESVATVNAQEPENKAARDDDLTVAVDGPSKQRVAALLRITDGRFSVEEVVPVLADATFDQNELVRAAGEVGIRRVGKEAVPVLSSMVDEGNRKAEEFAPICGSVRVLGVDAVEMFPVFQKALNAEDGPTQKMALFALQNMGDINEQALDRLIELLESKDLNVQIGVCRILEQLGPKADPAIDKLMNEFENGSVSSRSWAAIVLGAIGESNKYDILELLTERLDAFTLVDKQRAMIGLGNMGAKAKSAIGKVRELMNDPSKSCQPQAAVTLWQITGKSDESLKVLKELLPTIDYKQTVLEKLATMGPVAAPLTSDIAENLSSEDVGVRELASMALGKIGPGAKSALPKLRVLLNDEDALLRQSVADAIAAIEKDAG